MGSSMHSNLDKSKVKRKPVIDWRRYFVFKKDFDGEF